MPDTRLILPRFLVPVRPRGQVLEGHGIVVAGNRIEAVLPENEAAKAYPDATVVALRDHIVLPGLINMHTHSPMTLLRGYADDLALDEWLNRHIWPAESRHVTPEFVADGTRLAIAEMIRAGTTCFNDNYFFPDEMARVALEAGMRAVIGLPLLDQPTVWASDFNDYVDKGMAVVRQFEGEDLLRFTFAPHAPYSVSDSGLDRISVLASESGFRVHLHCLETRFDIEHSLETFETRPLERLSQHGLLNENLIAVHMTQLEDDDIELLARRGTHVVHCPQSNLKLASGICRVADLVGAGVNVSLGTDGAASNNNLDLLEEARFAALLAKGVSRDATAVDAVQTIDMLTINGAKALGMESEIGTIEAGKKADLCALDLASPATLPLHDPLSQVVYAASSARFSDVWIDGQRVLKEGALEVLDEAQVMAAAQAWQMRLESDRRPREAAL